MTASELAFLGLGLLLGAATGAALIVVVGTRLPRREIRVTVTQNALPRRSETLSQAAFATSPGEPAPGGPGDRRRQDREDARPGRGVPDDPITAGVPVMARPALGDERPGGDGPGRRTIVPMGPGPMRVQGVEGVERIEPPARPRVRPPVSTTVPIGSAATVVVEEDADRALEQASHPRHRGAALERILRGEHLVMVELLDELAGPDGPQRREWQVLIGGLVDGLAEMAVREAVIDFPLGTPFWDGFTIEQCRRIVGALASMGYRYDGHDGWVDNRVPAYRDLSQALADVGLEPRRIRAWPNSAEIAELFVGARPAPEELLAAAGPEYDEGAMRALLGDRAADLSDLWLAWEGVRPALFGEPLPSDSQAL